MIKVVASKGNDVTGASPNAASLHCVGESPGEAAQEYYVFNAVIPPEVEFGKKITIHLEE